MRPVAAGADPYSTSHRCHTARESAAAFRLPRAAGGSRKTATPAMRTSGRRSVSPPRGSLPRPPQLAGVRREAEPSTRRTRYSAVRPGQPRPSFPDGMGWVNEDKPSVVRPGVRRTRPVLLPLSRQRPVRSAQFRRRLERRMQRPGGGGGGGPVLPRPTVAGNRVSRRETRSQR